jgi:DNA-binding MarR family transcriptional regulator
MDTDSKLSSLPARERSAGYLTNWAARLYARAIDRELKPLGLSSAHLPVFFALADGAALPQRELAAAAAVEQPTMTATLARMERDGLVERRPHPDDRRSSLVSLTAGALEKAEAVRAAIARVNAMSLAALPAEEQERHLERLAAVVAALTAGLGSGPN